MVALRLFAPGEEVRVRGHAFPGGHQHQPQPFGLWAPCSLQGVGNDAKVAPGCHEIPTSPLVQCLLSFWWIMCFPQIRPESCFAGCAPWQTGDHFQALARLQVIAVTCRSWEASALVVPAFKLCFHRHGEGFSSKLKLVLDSKWPSEASRFLLPLKTCPTTFKGRSFGRIYHSLYIYSLCS